MIKFMVVLRRKPETTCAQFRVSLAGEHGELARRLPDLRRYVQNHVADDPRRARPDWDAIVELYWDDRDAMERAWHSADGRRATEHLAAFADVERTSWSIVDVDEIAPQG